jgi:hypothetical protein
MQPDIPHQSGNAVAWQAHCPEKGPYAFVPRFVQMTEISSKNRPMLLARACSFFFLTTNMVADG